MFQQLVPKANLDAGRIQIISYILKNTSII